MKLKFQKIWSKSKGIRHRLIYKKDNYYYIKIDNVKIKIDHIYNDIWMIRNIKKRGK